jgi:hypothetical protein
MHRPMSCICHAKTCKHAAQRSACLGMFTVDVTQWNEQHTARNTILLRHNGAHTLQVVLSCTYCHAQAHATPKEAKAHCCLVCLQRHQLHCCRVEQNSTTPSLCSRRARPLAGEQNIVLTTTKLATAVPPAHTEQPATQGSASRHDMSRDVIAHYVCCKHSWHCQMEVKGELLPTEEKR